MFSLPHDLHSKMTATQSLVPGAKNATATGSAVDLKDAIAALVVVDAAAWTDGSHSLSITSSDTSGGTFDTTAANTFGTLPVISSAPNGNQVYMFSIDVTRCRRFVKVVSTVTGATTGAVYGASVITVNRKGN